jgi:hypothetical protein
MEHTCHGVVAAWGLRLIDHAVTVSLFPFGHIDRKQRQSTNMAISVLRIHTYSIVHTLVTFVCPVWNANLSISKSAPSLGPPSRATSPAIPVRRIGRVYGLDRTSLGHFAKKLSNFSEINPQSHLFSHFFLRKSSLAFLKPTRNPGLFMGRPAFYSLGLRGLNSAKGWFPLSIIIFSFTNKFAGTLKLCNKSQKNRKIENQIVLESS